MSNDIQKLKVSLNDAIKNWFEEQSESDGYEKLDTYVSPLISELMTDAAFCILLSQSDLTKYYKEQDMLSE